MRPFIMDEHEVLYLFREECAHFRRMGASRMSEEDFLHTLQYYGYLFYNGAQVFPVVFKGGEYILQYAHLYLFYPEGLKHEFELLMKELDERGADVHDQLQGSLDSRTL